MAIVSDLTINLKINVEGGLERATKALERFTTAANAAADALQRLDGERHGGITFRVVGDLAHLSVEPKH